MSSKLPERQKSANAKYYSSKGGCIYSDFLTFAKGKALPLCNAAEFSRDFHSHGGSAIVCEYGVGTGEFAQSFLSVLKRQNPALYEKTEYHLFDISERMLSAARRTLCRHLALCHFHPFDAATDPPWLRFDYCRMNELLSDLPAEVFLLKKGGYYSCDLRKDSLRPSSAKRPGRLVESYLPRLGEGRAIPFNFIAEKFLLSLCSLGNRGFRADAFDYGFYSSEDVSAVPIDDWNRLVARRYGSQITVDLNFPQLLAALAERGIPCAIEGQREYAEGVLGCGLALRQSSGALDYVRAKGSGAFKISEDDGFYHLRIGR